MSAHESLLNPAANSPCCHESMRFSKANGVGNVAVVLIHERRGASIVHGLKWKKEIVRMVLPWFGGGVYVGCTAVDLFFG